MFICLPHSLPTNDLSATSVCSPVALYLVAHSAALDTAAWTLDGCLIQVRPSRSYSPGLCSRIRDMPELTIAVVQVNGAAVWRLSWVYPDTFPGWNPTGSAVLGFQISF